MMQEMFFSVKCPKKLPDSADDLAMGYVILSVDYLVPAEFDIDGELIEYNNIVEFSWSGKYHVASKAIVFFRSFMHISTNCSVIIYKIITNDEIYGRIVYRFQTLEDMIAGKMFVGQ